jgi:hypothetical protein
MAPKRSSSIRALAPLDPGVEERHETPSAARARAKRKLDEAQERFLAKSENRAVLSDLADR